MYVLAVAVFGTVVLVVLVVLAVVVTVVQQRVIRYSD